ncbi:MAG: transketolase [Sulfitobacter sp.]|nr:transketolase [Sulfitobacter sp.]
MSRSLPLILATTILALPAQAATSFSSADFDLSGQSHAAPETLWLAKNDKAKGNKGGGKAKGKPEKARKSVAKAEKQKGQAKVKGNSGKANGRAASKTAPNNSAGHDKGRRDIASVDRMLQTAAPITRDMTLILSGLALLNPDVVLANIPEDELITYRNCPPGLAKKNPPCVPPGLAKQGVSYEEWAAYDAQELDRIWLDRRRDYLLDRPAPDGNLLLSSDQIATLFSLNAAPQGQRYALIDGLPVLLDDKDYRSLLLVNELAAVPDYGQNIRIAPTAALTQQELTRLYRLPQLGEDENYAVVNGQLLRFTDSEYETLQLIRIARAVL